MNVWTCDHAEYEIRTKVADNGTQMIGQQCLECGRMVGTWLTKDYARKSRGPWDNALYEKFFHRQAKVLREHADEVGQLEWTRERARREEAQRHDKWLGEYREFLRTPKWAAIREKVLARARGWCEGCNEQKASQVHHLTYARVGGNEMLFDLVAICDDCHHKVHNK